MSLEELKQSHSFILLQTNCEKVAKHLPYVIYSHESEILDNQTNDIPITYNWTFDCSFYLVQRKPIVLTAKTPLPSLLTPLQQKILAQCQYLILKQHKEFKLYLYYCQHNEDDSRFVQISSQLVIHPDGYLMFQYDGLPSSRYRQISKYYLKKGLKGQWYTFCSEYALLSDVHFLNSVRSGKSPVGSYLKVGQDWYPYVDEGILGWVMSRLRVPKL